MKIKATYLWALLGIILSGLMCGCSDDTQESLAQGLQIKSFMPSAVMENSEMVIAGSNLHEVSAIVFPGGVEVRDFEVVTSNMIKVKVPAGISAGKLRLVAGDDVVESIQEMRLAAPVINFMEPGDEARERDVITFKGEDLDCIGSIIFPGAEGEDIVVDAMTFLRKSSGHLKVRVPVGILGGMTPIRLIAFDGNELRSQEINLVAVAKDPDGSVVCRIQHVGSERYLTRNSAEEYPRVMSYTGSKDQEFSFLPVDEMPGCYYLKNSATGEYLVIGDENDWRMFWVKDPTTITYPDRGMYEVVEVGGGNVQIKNVGSGNLGTDSNDENSEVYGNKYGDTEPRFLWRLDIISGDFVMPEPSSIVVWEGVQDFGEWFDFYLEPEEFAALTVGSVIQITIEASDAGWSNFDLQDYDWADFDGFAWKHPQDEWPDGIVKMKVTEDVFNRITSGGLRIRGAFFTLFKVEITGAEPAPEPSSILWEGEQEFGDWFVVKIEPEYMALLQPTDTIRMWFYPEPDQWPQMDLRDIKDVSFPGFEWLGLSDFVEAGYVDFPMDESIQQRLVSGGLLIRGSHYTLTKVEIVQ
ncbi:MAG: hypothetical protein K2L21_03665 [Muribaculaceae bacterium]|nr:hypothetical protein [Muribaculaceae bacterium]